MRGQMTHPDPDVLAEFRAGLGTGRRRARIASHLAACERCTGLSDQLGEIPALLAAAPAPAMPDAVAQRLESVLAAQVAQRDSSERTVGDGAHDRAHDRAHDPAHHRAHQGARHRARSQRPGRHWDFRLVALRVLAPACRRPRARRGRVRPEPHRGQLDELGRGGLRGGFGVLQGAGRRRRRALERSDQPTRSGPARARGQVRGGDQRDRLPARHLAAAAETRAATVRAPRRERAGAGARTGQRVRAPGDRRHQPGVPRPGRGGLLPGPARPT